MNDEGTKSGFCNHVTVTAPPNWSINSAAKDVIRAEPYCDGNKEGH